MSYGSGSGGSPSIAGSSDVVLNNPANSQVLAYDGSSSKWKNTASTALPAGGSTNQVLTKNSNTDRDAGWTDGVPLSDAAPLVVGVASAGSLTEASRADHQHGLLPGIGYAVVSTKYSSPLGPTGGSAGATIAQGTVLLTPFPVYNNISITKLHCIVSTAGSTAQMAVFDTDPTTWLPRTNVGAVANPTVNATGSIEASASQPIHLAPGMYWIGVLSLGSSLALERPLDYINTSRFLTDASPDMALHAVAYNNGSTYSTMPSSFAGQTSLSVAGSPFWYQFVSE